MIMHLGGDVTVPVKDIVAILDYSSSGGLKNTASFLKQIESKGAMELISGEEKKSFVIINSGGKTKVVLSPISSSTLLKRSNFVNGIGIQ